MGSFLQKLLTNPEDFKFYTGNQLGPVSPNNQNPRRIPFGRDRAGSKDSNQPYGWKKKPGDIGIGVMLEDFAETYEDTFGEADIDDFIIRGGVLAPLRAFKDAARLTRFFSDIKNPKGILFLAKQNLLSRIGTKTEASRGPGYAEGALNEGVYTPLSTIGQALVGFAGTHLNKQGLAPFASINKYQDVIAEKSKNFNELTLAKKTVEGELIASRLTNLKYSIVNSQKTPLTSYGGIKNYNIYPNESTLIKYGGGPGSALGFGSTKIKFATKNDGINKLTVFDNKNNINSFKSGSGLVPQPIKNNRLSILTNSTSSSDILLEYKGGPGSNGKVNESTKIKYATSNEGSKLTVFDTNNSKNKLIVDGARYKTWDYSLIKNVDYNNQLTIINNQNIGSDVLPDFRKKIFTDTDIKNSEYISFLSLSPDYTESHPSSSNIETKFGLGSPGAVNRNRSSYTSGSKRLSIYEPLDKVNASSIYKSKTTDVTKTTEIYSDIIPFIISILNNQNQPEGPYKKNMHFRAFIDSFSDSYDADWSAIEYMGRAEKLYKYKGFGRKITMAFTVVAQSREEITAMYNKLNFLASSLAPEYLPSGYMAGNIAYITLGGYIFNQPGIINSLTFDIPEESPWEIGINDIGKRDQNIKQLPHMIKVTGFNFTPIHIFKPEKQRWEDDPEDKASTKLITPGNQIYIAKGSVLKPSVSNDPSENLGISTTPTSLDFNNKDGTITDQNGNLIP